MQADGLGLHRLGHPIPVAQPTLDDRPNEGPGFLQGGKGNGGHDPPASSFASVDAHYCPCLEQCWFPGDVVEPGLVLCRVDPLEE